MSAPLESQAYPNSPAAPSSSPAGYVTPMDLSGGSPPPLTAEEIAWRRDHFLEFVLQEVVRAVVGFFFPGLGPAFDQLVAWANDLREAVADIPILGDLIEAITGIEDGDLHDLGTFFIGIRNAIFGLDLSNPGAIVAKIVELIGAAIRNVVSGLLNGDILVNTANLFGSLAGHLFSFIPIGAIGLPPARTPLAAGTFPDADSISGQGIWEFDPTVTRTAAGTGSAKVIADGTLKAMRGVPIAVAPGQRFEPAIFVRWSGYSGSGSPIQLHVVKFNGDSQVGITTLKTFTPPAASSAGLWVELAGSYPVEENVTSVRVRPVVTETATAGTFNFDDGGYRMKSNLMSNLTKWLGGTDDGDLFGNPDEFDPTDLIPEPFRDWIGAVLDGLQNHAPKNQPWADLIHSVLDAFGHIPDTNVLGVGGPATMGDTQQATWDQMVGGIVGAIGSGSSLSDIWNLMFGLSSNATRGGWAFDIASIRNNKGLDSGMLATSTSSIPFMQVATGAAATTFNLTQSTAITLYKREPESAPIGVVRWMGQDTTNITHFFVNIWKMDEVTGAREIVHASGNIIGDVSPTMSTNKYVVPVQIMREPSDIYGYELAIRGSGTYKVVGEPTWLHDDPDVFPRRPSSVRDSGTSAPPSTISDASTTYASNIPFIEVGIEVSATPIPRQPQKLQFGYTGSSETTVVPSWSKWVDLIPIGAGAGGSGALFAVAGVRGRAGRWNPLTLQVGVDIKAGSLITVTVGRWGGNGGGGSSGSAGDATVITYIDPADVVHTLTAAGGTPNNGPSHVGEAAGDVTVAGVLYRGGGSATFSNGSAPGGGGGGAIPYGAGYRGAPGGAWVVSRQS